MSKKTEGMTGLSTWKIAFRNMQYHKSKNILTGIAIFLTTMLLFVVPTVGKNMMDLQFAAINKVYPTWHALFRNVDSQTAEELAVRKDFLKYGLRSDPGFLMEDGLTGSMLYLDDTAVELMKGELSSGKFPQKEDEIVVSKGLLKALGQEGEIGDKITLTYQIERNGGLDTAQKKEFVICGFTPDSETGIEKKIFTLFVSKAFLQAEVPEEQTAYRFMFQLDGIDNSNTEQIEEKIKGIAKAFGILEKDMNINKEFLAANYVDPAVLPAIIIIMVVIMVAGMITIYSIYYVSMSQRIQEFGRLKAIGATKRQMKQIVLREGMLVAAIVVPFGLLLGTLVSKLVLKLFIGTGMVVSSEAEVMWEIIDNHEISLWYPWIYLLAAVVTFVTVYVSLLRPMKKAARISEVEAMRYQAGTGCRKSVRKGYEYLTIGRLARNSFFGNKRKSMITILSMSFTGIFMMVIATVLSCADPVESANNSITGQYGIWQHVEENNKEHPEWAWSEIQKNNPLNNELKAEIEALDGVKRVDVFSSAKISGGPFLEEVEVPDIWGVPETYKKEVEEGIIEGDVDYEDLLSGDKVIIDTPLLHWYPELNVGDKFTVRIHDGENSYEKELEIAGVGDYTYGLSAGNLVMAKDAVDNLCSSNISRSFQVVADKNYDEKLANELGNLITDKGILEMETWKAYYETYKNGMELMRGACFTFFGILGVICMMNLINTMINSVHIRKKELGMMQAVGMSDRQLGRMLQLEGLFYTAGTLVLSIGAGSAAGYPVFLWAKKTGMFEMSRYHYPFTVALIIMAVLTVVQIILVLFLSRSVKKESLIERVRFSE